ncbi:glycosyl hydrolase family 28 protein [Mucilaginibacter sp.]|uniref:glycoside hydrolase family 28 protein n=1 Tax=Mucilaginibacter sp. TaxID=1882438 RepID=UPI0026298CE5|nr:glycosyl hydrolase family 28 protein [Mucilaginibacter sp.]MDB4926127.1 glycoside hydrolase, family 28 [Mucilaginibacter sp.]
MKKQILILLLLGNALAAFAQKSYNIINYGAKTGAKYNNAIAIQKAIDAAAKNKGGRVIIPAGNFTTGPIILKSGVEIHFNDDAALLGSTNRFDYTEGKMAVISAKGQHDIAITGNGTINGQGRDLIMNVLQLLTDGKIQDDQWKIKRPAEKNRTNIFSIVDCTNVRVTGVTLRDASGWVQTYKNCTGVVIDHMKVESVAYWNNDGIDIVDSKNVKITNSFFNAADDAICLKSEDANKSCENIWVENCTLRSSASGFKLGTGSVGAFRKITVKNLTVYNTYRSAIALESVDGALIEDVDIRNVTGKNVGNAVFIRLGHRNTDARYSSIRNVLIDGVKADVPNAKPDVGYPLEGPAPKVAPHNLVPASITGLPGHLVQNVTLQNIDITYGGGANKTFAYAPINELDKVTENVPGYPEFTMFGELPSWGLYVRHAEGIKLNNFKIGVMESDFRPALIFDDVTGLSLNNLTVPQTASLPTIVYKGVGQLTTSGVTLPAGNNAVITQK